MTAKRDRHYTREGGGGQMARCIEYVSFPV